MIQAKLEEAEARLKNIPTIEGLREKIEKLESMLTKSEADRLDLFPPKIEAIDKKTPVEVLAELFSQGYTTVPLDKLKELYVSYAKSARQQKWEKEEKEHEHEILMPPPNSTAIGAELRNRQSQGENVV